MRQAHDCTMMIDPAKLYPGCKAVGTDRCQWHTCLLTETPTYKSRSTTNWPILACSVSTSSAEIAGSAAFLPSKAEAMFRVAVLYQPVIIVG